METIILILALILNYHITSPLASWFVGLRLFDVKPFNCHDCARFHFHWIVAGVLAGVAYLLGWPCYETYFITNIAVAWARHKSTQVYE